MMATGLINKPIALAEIVAKVLGTTDKSVGNLCTNENINKWARYKPFRNSAKHFVQDEENDFHDPSGDRNIALKSANYALRSPAVYNNAEATKADTSAWQYRRPTGGSASPYRLSDFLNYFHSATFPWEYMGDIDVCVLFDNKTAVFRRKEIITVEDAVVPFDELIDGYYIAICLTWQQNGVTISDYMTSSDGELSVDTLYGLMGSNSCSYYLALTDREKKLGEAAVSAHWKVLPFDNSISELMGAIRLSTDNPLSYTITGVNNVLDSYFFDPKDYVGPLPTGAPASSYFGIQGSYILYLEYLLTNDTDITRTIYAARLMARSDTQNFSGNIVTTQLGCGLFDENGARQVSIDVPALGSVKVRIGVPPGLFIGDSRGTAVTPLPNQRRAYNIRINLTNGSISTLFVNQQIRLRNF